VGRAGCGTGDDHRDEFDNAGNLTRSRPVCAYPAQAVYNGSGDINRATSSPARRRRPRDRDEVTDSDLVNIRNALTQRDLMVPNR
jgi:hypothetical protein